jgi:hypothetical protein
MNEMLENPFNITKAVDFNDQQINDGCMTVVARGIWPIEGEEGTLPGGAGPGIPRTGRSGRIGYGDRDFGFQASPVSGVGRDGL